MKKLLFLGLGSILCLGASAQFYISGQGGYGVGASKEILGLEIVDFDEDTDTLTTQRNIYGTYGGGTSFSLNAGYLKKNIGFDLGISYLMGAKQTKEETIETTTDGEFSDKSTAYTRQLRVEPSFIIKSPLGKGDKLNLMTKVGLVIPVSGATYGERISDAPGTINGIKLFLPEAARFEAESEINGQFTIGYKMAISGNYQLKDNLVLFGEVNYTSLRIRRKTYEITRGEVFDENGQVIGDLDDETVRFLLGFRNSYIYTEYTEDVVPDDVNDEKKKYGNDYGTKDHPHHELPTDANFSALNFNIGVRYLFGGKAE